MNNSAPMPPVVVRPTHGPSASAPRDLADWDSLIDGALDRAKVTAEKWRTGLAAFITLLTGLLLFKGPEEASSLAQPYNWIIIGLLVVGGLLAVVALWKALEAAAPSTVSRTSFTETVKEYGSIRARNMAAAEATLTTLTSAKRWMVPSLALIALGVVLWWIAPTPVATYVSVTGTQSVCGVLESSSLGTVTIRPSNVDAITLDIADLKSIHTVTKC